MVNPLKWFARRRARNLDATIALAYVKSGNSSLFEGMSTIPSFVKEHNRRMMRNELPKPSETGEGS